MLFSEDKEENIQALKKFQSNEEGLQIEYRCPRCRQCVDCKKSFETERVSLREEQEDQMIRDSIVIDKKNKQIVCKLPVRGEEHQFLSNNRDIALKILDQQCLKYHKDDETREVIVKAFDKLIRNKQLVLWSDLSEEEKSMIESKKINYWIPWRVVFKASLSTPARPVFDGSTNTKVDAEGNGGRSLNDLVVKGKVTTLNLLKMIMRFQAGAAAVQGDLKQFYASIKLVAEQWHLQRVLFKENLDPDAKVIEGIIKTLIWGIKCVSGLSEAAVIQLAESVQYDIPALFDFLINGRFCDDLGNSKPKIEELKALTKEADKLFESVGLACKGWSFSGEEPSPEVADEGLVSIGGMKWQPIMDSLEVLIPPLHFNRKCRGRLPSNTEVFEGTMMDQIDAFVPKQLSRRMIFMKQYSLYDICGKLAPITGILKYDLRQSVKQTIGWDDPSPDHIRTKWLKNFLLLEKLRGLKFQRAIMPETAVSCKMNMIVMGDVSEEDVEMIGAWGRFPLKTGGYSCQLMLGRSLLANEDDTLAKKELNALTHTSNMNWLLTMMLEDWLDGSIVCGDSTIALSWSTSTKKRLSLFHRNRVVQIQRGTNPDQLYHVISEENAADIGTRPSQTSLSDVGPNSPWEKGKKWMRGEIEDAVKNGILTPVSALRIKDEQEEDFKKGFVYEKQPEIITKGHPVMTTNRVEKIKERQMFSDYILSPGKYPFERDVRILAMVRKCLRKWSKKTILKTNPDHSFQMFPVNQEKVNKSHPVPENKPHPVPENKPYPVPENTLTTMMIKNVVSDYELFTNFSIGVKKPGIQFKGEHHVELENDDISWALQYLFEKGSEEVKQFYSKEFVKKISIEKSGILYAKSRILDTQRFKLAAGLELNENIDQFNLKCMVPVLDRFSALSYSIGSYIHRTLSKHGGYETSYRHSLNHCFIIQGLGLFRELGEECVKCAKMRKKYLEIKEGPVSNEMLTIAPPFYVTMCDLYGPYQIYVPGHAMKTRHRNITEAKCYVLVSVCPITKCVNLQVIESKSADGFLDGVTRLCCEVGVPSLMIVDQDSGILKALKEAEVDILDIDRILHTERGMRFKTVPVSGHNYNGLCERKIRTVQEMLEKANIDKLRLHATGLQTYMKLIENDINNTPFGYSFSRDSDNSPLLKLIFPNLLRIGRNNSRSLGGPIKMPKNVGELMSQIQKAYDAFYRIFNTSVVPKLMRLHNKWHSGDSEIKVGDIVYFRKSESELTSKWTVGKVSEVTVGKDGSVRRVIVDYQNHNETFTRSTDRAARSLIKLFNIEDTTWSQDLDLVDKLIKDIKGQGARPRLNAVSGPDFVRRQTGVQFNSKAQSVRTKLNSCCKTCCCLSHCQLTPHAKKDEPVLKVGCEPINVLQYYLLDRSWDNFDAFENELEDNYPANFSTDAIMSLICGVNMDFSSSSDDSSTI